jgi:hypothetical protein
VDTAGWEVATAGWNCTALGHDDGRSGGSIEDSRVEKSCTKKTPTRTKV